MHTHNGGQVGVVEHHGGGAGERVRQQPTAAAGRRNQDTVLVQSRRRQHAHTRSAAPTGAPCRSAEARLSGGEGTVREAEQRRSQGGVGRTW